MEFFEDEYDAFIDEVTVNETYFFREEKHFRVLREHVIPALSRLPRNMLHVWSAACSTGEEAISLAMTFAAEAEVRRTPPFTVYASDICGRALRSLEEGRYGKNSFREDGRSQSDLMSRYLTKEDGHWNVDRHVMRSVVPMKHNLLRLPPDELPERVHLVFLRNTLIYMADGTRRTVLDNVASRLEEGGYLFVSSTELPLLAHPELTLEEYGGTYFFRKASASKPTDLPTNQPAAETPPDGTPGSERTVGDRPDRRQEDRSHDRAAGKYLEVVIALDESDTTGAAAALAAIDPEHADDALFRHLQGLLSMRFGDETAAEASFRSALASNPLFWPSRFSLAMILRRNRPPNALREFDRCAEHIRGYIDRNERAYDFLLEGFDAKYYLNTCRKLRNTG